MGYVTSVLEHFIDLKPRIPEEWNTVKNFLIKLNAVSLMIYYTFQKLCLPNKCFVILMLQI